ncbi:MAG TPA: folylpolyglutamate synthase/dihydrofolate synthase family protein [Candidatus Avamphibacillus sp.]|nr:folylpolyglutamate synthase/dihydrofolate synthase family protein [Candidatus Avamphibacillus sp.]
MFYHLEEVNRFFENRRSLGVKPGLSRMNQLLTYLDNPQKKIKAVHVAGTNGKGSTIHFLKNALIKNGHEVGLFISPSMSDVTGYIFKNNKRITEERLISILNEMFPIIQRMDESDMPPTEFEIITAIAFFYFVRHVDIALIETGMGGREDTTNCVNPLLSVITNVSLDHTTFLGSTLEKIAYHKAGIIKNNIPVILGEIQPSVLNIFEKEAELKGAPIYRLMNEYSYSNIKKTEEVQFFTWKDRNYSMEVSLLMNGNHQVQNSSIAIKVLTLLKEQGIEIQWKKALEAIHYTKVEGRFELMNNQPAIILDGAHNPAGIESFLKTISTTHQNKKHLIFGVFKDKDLDYMIRKCIPYFDSITLTSFEHSRAADYEILTKYMEIDKVNLETDWKGFLTSILRDSNKNKITYFITGSLHFIANVRLFLKEEY